MGHNVNLQWLLGLPSIVQCPHCRMFSKTLFDDYDIDCGEPNAIDNIMNLDIQCSECEKMFDYRVEILKKEEY